MDGPYGREAVGRGPRVTRVSYVRGGMVGYLVTKVPVLFDISTAVDAAGRGLSVAENFARNDPNLATLRPINCAAQWWGG